MPRLCRGSGHACKLNIDQRSQSLESPRHAIKKGVVLPEIRAQFTQSCVEPLHLDTAVAHGKLESVRLCPGAATEKDCTLRRASVVTGLFEVSSFLPKNAPQSASRRTGLTSARCPPADPGVALSRASICLAYDTAFLPAPLHLSRQPCSAEEHGHSCPASGAHYHGKSQIFQPDPGHSNLSLPPKCRSRKIHGMYKTASSWMAFAKNGQRRNTWKYF